MYVGLDVHKKYNHACVMDKHGNVVQEQKFLNTIEELDGFLEDLPDDSKIVMEACSVWEPIFDYIESKGFDVELAHPLKTRLIAEARVKTDKVDAEALAHLRRADLLPKSYVPPANIRKLRFIVRHRASLVKIRTMVKNKIHALLWKEGISTELTDLFGKQGMEALRTIQLKTQHRFALNNYLKLLDVLNECIADTEAYINVQSENLPQVKMLARIPGIGIYSALLIYAEIGEISRFKSYRKLCSYAGLTASVYQSGNTLRYGKITKQGSKWLRWIMLEIVSRHVWRIKPLHKFYKRLSLKKTNIAKVASARKLLIYIYIMLTRNIEFERLRVNA